MSDIKLFRLTAGLATELQGNASDLEKPLQTLIETNLEPLLNIRFLASEYSTGKTHGARNVAGMGHWGTGDLELALSSLADFDAAKSFIAAAYEGRAA